MKKLYAALAVILLIFTGYSPAMVAQPVVQAVQTAQAPCGYVLTIGTSMEPEIRSGDIIYLCYDIEYQNLTKGLIIRFKNGETYILHRIFFVYRVNNVTEAVMTKADNSDLPDFNLLKAEDILGVAKYLIRDLRQ